jgi:hypothetical protein
MTGGRFLFVLTLAVGILNGLAHPLAPSSRADLVGIVTQKTA